MEPSWQPDPTGRHHYRWWDGKAWSDIVADDGEESHDPMPSASGPRRIVVSTTPEPGQWKAQDPTPWRGMRLPSAPVHTDDVWTNGAAGGPEPTDATDQMPVKPDDSSPNRIFIDTTRSDIPAARFERYRTDLRRQSGGAKPPARTLDCWHRDRRRPDRWSGLPAHLERLGFEDTESDGRVDRNTEGSRLVLLHRHRARAR